jgi:Ca2+-binding RTX toxin-like protein
LSFTAPAAPSSLGAASAASPAAPPRALYALNAPTGILAANLFKNLTLGGAQNADDVILYDDTRGALYYDTSGLATDGVVHFATLTGGPPVTEVDFVMV